MPHYYKSKSPLLLGDVPVTAIDKAADKGFSLTTAIESPGIKLAAGAAATYHGYCRTGSIVWALVYGLLGKWKPQIVIPVAVAQGFGKRKGGQAQLTSGGGS